MTQSYEIQKLCSNPVVNMLLCHYLALAKESRIDFRVRIEIPEELPIQDMDISVLLGNLLENAVTASSRIPEAGRSIRLNMICVGKMLAITVDNSFDGIVKKDSEGAYLSTRHSHRGLGLKSLTEIAEQYGGGAEFSHDKQTFHSSVMLGLDRKQY